MGTSFQADERARWVVPPAEPRLEADEVHVWRAELDRSPGELEVFGEILSPEELARAKRLPLERERHRFICARGVLRSILSVYLGVPADSLAMEYAGHGKPFLGDQCGPGGLHFNLSHSANLAMVAVARGVPVGVDIERVDRDVEMDVIAARHFAPEEAAALGQLQGAIRVLAFFALWTRKGAFLKAMGDGAGLDLRSITVPLDGDGLVRHAGAVEQWYVRGLPPMARYAGAVVVAGERSPTLRCFAFQGHRSRGLSF